METTAQDPQDAELVRASLGGSVPAFERLVERYFDTVYAIGYARLRHRESAEDLTQEVFLRVYLFLHKLRDGKRFAAWVARIARNLAHDWQLRGQRASRLLPTLPLEQVGGDVADPRGVNPRHLLADRDAEQVLERAFSELPPAESEVVLLRFGEDLSAAEIARRLGLHRGSVHRLLRKAGATMRASTDPVLRETIRSLHPRPAAMARTIALIGATAALSAKSKTAVAQAAGSAAWLASIELPVVPATAAGAGAAAGGGVLGLLHSIWTMLAGLPAALASGGKAVLAIKGTIAALVAAVAVGGGIRLRDSATTADSPTAARSTLFVRVVDTSDEPVAGASVALIERIPEAPNGPVARGVGRTDSRGELPLSFGALDSVQLRISCPGFTTGTFVTTAGAPVFEAILSRLSETQTPVRGLTLERILSGIRAHEAQIRTLQYKGEKWWLESEYSPNYPSGLMETYDVHWDDGFNVARKTVRLVSSERGGAG